MQCWPFPDFQNGNVLSQGANRAKTGCLRTDKHASSIWGVAIWKSKRDKKNWLFVELARQLHTGILYIVYHTGMRAYCTCLYFLSRVRWQTSPFLMNFLDYFLFIGKYVTIQQRESGNGWLSHASLSKKLYNKDLIYNDISLHA